MINGYIYFFFVFFLCFKALFTEEEMTIRIKQVIDNTSFAIIFNEEGENYSIITPFHLFELNKQNDSINLKLDLNIESNNEINLDSKALLFKMNNIYYILLSTKKFYHISFKENPLQTEDNKIFDFDVLGFFSKKSDAAHQSVVQESENANTNNYETIIYGKKHGNIIFYDFSKLEKIIFNYKSGDFNLLLNQLTFKFLLILGLLNDNQSKNIIRKK